MDSSDGADSSDPVSSGREEEQQSEVLRASLHGRGQRLTPQRQRILALFEGLGEGSHLSAEQVHQRLLGSQARVSLATVYRTLRLLSSMGVLQELELPEGGRRFELASASHRDHHHLVCVRCGRTEEFESAAVLAAGTAAADAHGFRLLECVLNLRALCPSCLAAEAQAPQGSRASGASTAGCVSGSRSRLTGSRDSERSLSGVDPCVVVSPGVGAVARSQGLT